MSLVCCTREPFISFANIKCLSTNFDGAILNILKESSFALVRTWKTFVSHAVAESIQIQMSMSRRIEKRNKWSLVRR